MCSCSILKFELVSYPTKLFVMMSKRLCLNLLMSCLFVCLKIRLEIDCEKKFGTKSRGIFLGYTDSFLSNESRKNPLENPVSRFSRVDHEVDTLSPKSIFKRGLAR